MPVSHGFWSYVHDDDRAEGGRISDLATDVADQYRLHTTEELTLFRDKEHLGWGADWRRSIDRALEQANFLIPVITPRYFQRQECRRELDLFTRRAVELGVSTLVLPILWADNSDFRENPANDPLITLVRQLSWRDWTQLRFEPRTSGEYRRAVADLAEQLHKAGSEAEGVPVPTAGPGDAPAYLAVLGSTDETVRLWLRTTDGINAKLSEVGVIMQRLVRPPRTHSEWVETANLLVMALSVPVSDLERLSTEFVERLHEIDLGVRRLADRWTAQTAANPDLTDPLAEFAVELRTQSERVLEELRVADDLITIITEIEAGSRALRPTARALRKSLTLLSDGRAVLGGWPPLLDRFPPAPDGRLR